MKHTLWVFILSCAGCITIPTYCPHYFVVTNNDGKNVYVYFQDKNGDRATIQEYQSVKEADEAAKDMNSKIGSTCK